MALIATGLVGGLARLGVDGNRLGNPHPSQNDRRVLRACSLTNVALNERI